MLQVNMLDAKSNLSHLVKLLESKEEDVIYIARNGKEVAQMTLIPVNDTGKRIGAAKGKFTVPANFDSDDWNNEVSGLFLGGNL